MEIGYLEIFFLLFSIPLIFQYLYVNYLFKTSKNRKYKPYLTEKEENSLLKFQSDPPIKCIEGSDINYGKYLKPFPNPNLNLSSSSFRLKEWQFHSISSKDWFFGMAIVNLHYVGQAFVYAVEKTSGLKYEYEELSPFAFAIKEYASSSISGNTTWKSGHTLIQFNYDEKLRGYNIQLNALLKSKQKSQLKIEGSFQSVRDPQFEELALLFPLDVNKPAYTHKTPLQITQGSVHLNGKELPLKMSPSALDWTRSIEHRLTCWKWASFCGIAQSGEHVLVNLTSSERFLDKENVIWINGKLYELDEVNFYPSTEFWKAISSANLQITIDKPKIDLFFEPVASKTVAFNYILIGDSFIQTIGKYHGSIYIPQYHSKTLYIENIWGVGESHIAYW